MKTFCSAIKSCNLLRQAREDGAEEGLEAGFDAFAGFHDFLVRERLIDDSGGHVGDAGDGKDFDSHVTGGDHFEGSGHADEIGADDAEIVDLGGSFVAGAEQGGVDALVQGHSEFGGFVAGDCAVVLRVSVGHVGEADAEAVVVGADQGIGSLQVDVVANQDQRALLIVEVDSSGGVGEDDGADSHASEDAHGEGDLMGRVAFVEMDAALHRGHGDGGRVADDELSGVTDGGGTREGRDFGVWDFCCVGEGIGEAAETGAEDEADAGAQGGSLQDGLSGGFGERELIVHIRYAGAKAPFLSEHLSRR